MKYRRTETAYFCFNCLHPYMFEMVDSIYHTWVCGRCGLKMAAMGRVAVPYVREWDDNNLGEAPVTGGW